MEASQSKYQVAIPFNASVHDLSGILETDVNTGLAYEEALKRNEVLGLNAFDKVRQKSLLLVFIKQLNNPLVFLLAFGSAISFYFGDAPEGIAILAVIVINAVFGFFMEFQAMRSMKSLKSLDINTAKVIRDGQIKEINSEQLTVGDVVFLEAGDVVPADGRIFEPRELQADESALTGESMPVWKDDKVLEGSTVLAERTNMVYKGTSVIKGNGKVIITGIGSGTEVGKITTLVANAEENATPLDKKLNALTTTLIWATIVLAGIFIITGFIQNKELYLILETAIALSVAAIPEGLPIVATISLAYGMLLMARKNAIVKRLDAVETLGGTNVILTDKTGTLTENIIRVSILVLGGKDDEQDIQHFQPDTSKTVFDKVLLVSALCNNASIHREGEKVNETGDPLEIALLKFFSDYDRRTINELKSSFPRVSEIPFSSETKTMATLHKSTAGFLVTAKGSVEDLLNSCSFLLTGEEMNDLTPEVKNAINAKAEAMSERGLRVLAFAYREAKETPGDKFMDQLIFAGMIGFLDPPRTSVVDAMKSCREAGIRVVMVTGDHPKTALTIAQKVNLVESGDNKVMNGAEILEATSWSPQDKDKILSTSVFARVTPQQKLDIVKLHQENGNIIAMTGDGVNDAPALKQSDVGIAMGLRGTQVAKETADIILKDDSFISIVEAISHGRVIFQNIQKFVIYLLSCNLSEIFLVTLLSFLFPEATLFPLQILFLNLVTDIFPALALGVGKQSEGVMKNPPRDPKEPVITRMHWQWILLYASAISFSITAGVLYARYYLGLDGASCNNIAFFGISLAQLWHVFNISYEKRKILVNEITTNKFVWYALALCFSLITIAALVSPFKELLEVKIMTREIWLLATLISLSPVLIIQIFKRIFLK